MYRVLPKWYKVTTSNAHLQKTPQCCSRHIFNKHRNTRKTSTPQPTHNNLRKLSAKKDCSDLPVPPRSVAPHCIDQAGYQQGRIHSTRPFGRIRHRMEVPNDHVLLETKPCRRGPHTRRGLYRNGRRDPLERCIVRSSRRRSRRRWFSPIRIPVGRLG